MKILSILLILFFINCEGPRYQIAVCKEYDKDKVAEYVKAFVGAATKPGLGGDYEDVDDTISEATRQAISIYNVQTRCIAYCVSSGCSWILIPQKDMTEKERKIFDHLLETGNGMYYVGESL